MDNPFEIGLGLLQRAGKLVFSPVMPKSEVYMQGQTEIKQNLSKAAELGRNDEMNNF
jgi:hypothetical protein